MPINLVSLVKWTCFLKDTKYQSLFKKQTHKLNNTVYQTNLICPKNFPTKKTVSPVGFAGELYQTFKEGILSVCPDCFRILKREHSFQLVM